MTMTLIELLRLSRIVVDEFVAEKDSVLRLRRFRQNEFGVRRSEVGGRRSEGRVIFYFTVNMPKNNAIFYL